MAKRLWDKGQGLNEQVQQFTVGSDPIVDLHIIGYDIVASAAHARMLASIGVLEAEELDALLTGLRQLSEENEKGSLTIPFDLEDAHTTIENALVERVGDVGRKIHAGRSRNDQVLVAVRLFMRDAILATCLESLSLAQTFIQKAEQCIDTPMPGHTHMQRAMPTTFGVWFHSFAEGLLASAQAGLHLLERCNVNPLGVASGFGVPLALDRAKTAELLGFDSVQRNPIAVVSSRGRLELQCLQWYVETAATIEKFAFDMVLFCSEEFKLCSLPDEFTTGSSIMPQKRNPDVAELMRGKVAQLRGAASELEWIIAKLPSNYHRDHQLTKDPLCRATTQLTALLQITNAVVPAVKIDAESAKSKLGPELFATYEAYRLVDAGVSFRQAYVDAAKSYQAGTLDIALLQNELEKIISTAKRELSECTIEVASTKKVAITTSKRFTDAQLAVLSK